MKRMKKKKKMGSIRVLECILDNRVRAQPSFSRLQCANEWSSWQKLRRISHSLCRFLSSCH
jgi:hypothetical protein